MFGLGKSRTGRHSVRSTHTAHSTHSTHPHPHTQAMHAHTHATDYPKTSVRKNRIRGLKAAINNPRTTGDGRDGAAAQLRSMGVRPNRPSLGTRIRNLLHLPGKSHHRNAHAHHARAY